IGRLDFSLGLPAERRGAVEEEDPAIGGLLGSERVWPGLVFLSARQGYGGKEEQDDRNEDTHCRALSGREAAPLGRHVLRPARDILAAGLPGSEVRVRRLTVDIRRS